VCVSENSSSVKRASMSRGLKQLFHSSRFVRQLQREEWAWLQRHAVGGACGSGSREGGDEAVIDSSGVEDFVKALRSAVIQLLTKLNVPLERALREALDSSEVTEATERLAHVTQLAQSLSALWRESRWLMDVIHTLRSKSSEGAVPLGRVMTSRPPIRSDATEDTPPAHTLNTGENNDRD
ncbi:hypothetical protein DPX16_1230, partial [Anabarilius grahami]